jgi:hypothetical protein
MKCCSSAVLFCPTVFLALVRFPVVSGLSLVSQHVLASAVLVPLNIQAWAGTFEPSSPTCKKGAKKTSAHHAFAKHPRHLQGLILPGAWLNGLAGCGAKL